MARDATPEQVKTAYRELAFRFHPDTNKSPSAHQRFLEINEAHGVLSDPKEKAKYDRLHDRHHGRQQGGQTSQSSYERLERTRAKRASRYSRSMYSQRVKYRGTASQSSPEERASKEKQKEAFRQRQYEQTKAQSRQRGFQGFAQVLQALALICLVFSFGMVLDKGFASWHTPEIVKDFQPVPWSISEPGVSKVFTSGSQFGLSNSNQKYLPIGGSVRIKKSVWTQIPVQVELNIRGRNRLIRTYGGRYDDPFPFVWLVIILCVLTLLFRRSPESNTYLGAATLFVAINFLGIIFIG